MTWASLLDWAPSFALTLARVGGAMALLPALGESAAPAIVRIGLALGITILLLPDLQPMTPVVPESGLQMALMVAGEVATGLWFGWVARMFALALPIAAQFIAYLIGLSSVLQPDAELGSQSTALGKLFELAAPMLILSTGLYVLPLKALDGLFRLIPPGHMLPAGDSAEVALHAVGTAFGLALQLASPFVVADIVWHVAIGQIARAGSRMQIYFVSMPGQILGGLALLMLTGSAIILAWRDSAQSFLGLLPGSQ
nr:flagellar biosynthetic protein FliR [uncultured Rhodopila sp.]